MQIHIGGGFVDGKDLWQYSKHFGKNSVDLLRIVDQNLVMTDSPVSDPLGKAEVKVSLTSRLIRTPSHLQSSGRAVVKALVSFTVTNPEASSRTKYGISV